VFVFANFRLAFDKFSKFPDCLVDVKSIERDVCLDRLVKDPAAQTGTADILDFLSKVSTISMPSKYKDEKRIKAHTPFRHFRRLSSHLLLARTPMPIWWAGSGAEERILHVPLPIASKW